MIFKDRVDAGNKLASVLLENLTLVKRKQAVIVSLLRGGTIVGNIVAKKLGIVHYPLVVTKISSPFNLEYAIGALCQDVVCLNRGEVSPINKKLEIIRLQIQIAKIKNQEYKKKYQISPARIATQSVAGGKIKYQNLIINKTVVLVDDGIATGTTIIAAQKFILSCKPKQIILAVPVAPIDFDDSQFDASYILHKDKDLSAVSQFYAYFPQVEEKEINQILRIEGRK